MKNNIMIKDFVKAGKAAESFNGSAGPKLHAEFITDGRVAIALSSLDMGDRSVLIVPGAAAPTAPAVVNCETEAAALERDRILREARTAQAAYDQKNAEATARLGVLTGLSGCGVLQPGADFVWKTPAKLRAFRFTGLVSAPAVGMGTNKRGKKYKAPEICIFEEVIDTGAPAARSGISYNTASEIGRELYENDKKEREEAARAYLENYFNEPEKPGYGSSVSGLDDEERAPFAPRRIGINRVYVELLEIGGDIVFMDAEKESGPVFCEALAAPGATVISGALVMPVKAA